MTNIQSSFGAQAARQYQALLQQDPVRAADTPIRYANGPANATDALGYAYEDVRFNDVNRNMVLDGPNESAGMSPLDTDRNGVISVVEDAAFVLYQDRNKDGTITPMEIQQAFGNLGNAGQELAQIRQQQNLDALYQQMTNPTQPPPSSPPSLPPPSLPPATQAPMAALLQPLLQIMQTLLSLIVSSLGR